MNNRRLTTRDYKNKHSTAFEFARWKQFAWGLGGGLLVALVIFVSDHRAPSLAPEDKAPVPRPASPKPAAATTADPDTGEQYEFYKQLPKFEVVVPEKEHVARNAPTAKIEQPGVYFLQAGSFHDETVAQRIHDQLQHQGIDAAVQRVALDADVWYRVRIGPIRDLDKLNALRQKLRAANLDALVINVAQ